MNRHCICLVCGNYSYLDQPIFLGPCKICTRRTFNLAYGELQALHELFKGIGIQKNFLKRSVFL